MSEAPGADTLELERRAKIKAGMLRMCEPIEFGSDAAIIEELVDALASLRAEKEELRRERDEARAIVRDIAEFGARHNIEQFGNATYRNGFMEGQRALFRALTVNENG